MRLLNFGHPLSADALTELGVSGDAVVNIRVQLDMTAPLTPQVSQIVSDANLTSQEWATESILVNLPGMAMATGLVLAEIHGRAGGFPRVVSLVRGEDGVFRLGEVIDLQLVRNNARLSR